MTTPLDRSISVSLFKNAFSTTPEVQHLALRSLDRLVLKRHRANSADIREARLLLPLFKPGTFTGGREADNLVSIDCIEGDYDAGRAGPDWAVARLIDAGIAAYIYTTSRHTEEHPRFRIICPLSRTMDPREWEKHFLFLNQALGHALDLNAARTSQGYFIGWLESCEKPEICLVEAPGCDFIDVALARRTPTNITSNLHSDEAASKVEDEDPFDGICFHSEKKIELTRSMLSVISADDYDTWIRVGLVLHHEVGPAGFAMWDEWSAASANYGKTESKWRTFGLRETGRRAGFGSLRKLALQAGWSDPGADQDIVRMNERHALVMVRGKALVVTFDDEGFTSFGQLKDLHALYENDRVPVSDRRTEPVSKKWVRHEDRRTYTKGVTFAPGRSPPGKLNLWTGWKVQPDPEASCKLFLDHIRDVICASDRDAEQYVLGWLAHLVQRSWEIPGVALVLRGEKGVGKDTFADYLVPIIGRQHVPTVSQGEHVTGRFNSRLEAALILHLQEGIWGGDRKAEQILKYLTTSGIIEIERKGIDAFNIESCLRIIMTGNEDWMIPASADERRFAVLDVSNCRQGDAGYFAALHAEMRNGGPAALLHYLQNHDIDGFNVRRPPATKGLLEQKLRSLRGVEKWWFECLAAGEILPQFLMGTDDDLALQWEAGPVSVPKSRIRSAYAAYLRSRRHEGDPVDDATFSKALREVLPGLRIERPRQGEARPRHFVFPKLDVCREEFEARQCGVIEWPS